MGTRRYTSTSEILNGNNLNDDSEEEVEMDTFSEESSDTESSCSSDYIEEIEERLNQLTGDVDCDSFNRPPLSRSDASGRPKISDLANLIACKLENLDKFEYGSCSIAMKKRKIGFNIPNIFTIPSFCAAKKYERSHSRHRSSKTNTSGSSKSSTSDYLPAFSQRRPKRDKKLIRLLNTMLLRAVMRSDANEVQRLLHTKVNPTAVCRTRHFSTCHVAALHDTDILSLLLKRGAKRNTPDDFGRTPLHIAAWTGNLKPLLALLELPPVLQRKLEEGDCIQAEIDIKKLTADADLKDILAARCHQNSVVTRLPKYYFDNKDHSCEKISLPEMQPGWTPLHAAASTARVLCCRVLLAAGADPCATTDEGLTPLDVAGSEFLQDHNQPDGSAQPKTAFTDIVNLLVNERRCDSESEPKNKWIRLASRNTSLHTAVELESTQDAVVLLQSGVSPMTVNSALKTPYHLCVQKRNKELLQILVDHLSQEDPPKYAPRCGNGYSVLHSAVQISWYEGVSICLKSKVSASMEPEYNGETFAYSSCIRKSRHLKRNYAICKSK